MQIGVFHDGIQRYSLMPARTSNTVMTNDPAPVGLGGANGPNYGVNTTYTVDISGTKHVVVRQDETTEDVIDEITAPIQR